MADWSAVVALVVLTLAEKVAVDVLADELEAAEVGSRGEPSCTTKRRHISYIQRSSRLANCTVCRV